MKYARTVTLLPSLGRCLLLYISCSTENVHYSDIFSTRFGGTLWHTFASQFSQWRHRLIYCHPQCCPLFGDVFLAMNVMLNPRSLQWYIIHTCFGGTLWHTLPVSCVVLVLSRPFLNTLLLSSFLEMFIANVQLSTIIMSDLFFTWHFDTLCQSIPPIKIPSHAMYPVLRIWNWWVWYNWREKVADVVRIKPWGRDGERHGIDLRWLRLDQQQFLFVKEPLHILWVFTQNSVLPCEWSI